MATKAGAASGARLKSLPGPLGASLPELFPTEYRYTATGISYNIAGILGGDQQA